MRARYVIALLFWSCTAPRGAVQALDPDPDAPIPCAPGWRCPPRDDCGAPGALCPEGYCCGPEGISIQRRKRGEDGGR